MARTILGDSQEWLPPVSGGDSLRDQYKQQSGGWTPDGEEKKEDESQEQEEDKKKTKHKPKTTKKCVLQLVYTTHSSDEILEDPPSSTIQTFVGKKLQPVKFEDVVKDNETFMTKEGYWFYGWSYNKELYLPGTKIVKEWTSKQSGTTKYNFCAEWTNKEIVVYCPDDDSDEEHYTCTYVGHISSDEAVGVTLKNAIFHRTGYTQIGWAIEKGGNKTYDLGSQYALTAEASTLVLYPAWQANTYTVTIKRSDISAQDIVLSATYDQEITMPDDDSFTKEHYYLDCFNEDKDGLSSSWFPGKIYVFKRTENITLYPIWAGDEFKVYYDGQYTQEYASDHMTLVWPSSGEWTVDRIESGGLILLGEQDITDHNFKYSSIAVYGSSFYTDRIPYPPEKEYYTFGGWKADDGTVLTRQGPRYDSYTYHRDTSIWDRAKDTVLYPIWLPYYPFGKIFFGGRYSDEFGIYVSEPPSYSWPAYEYTHHKAFGKNGDVLSDTNRYENVKRVYKISAYDGADYYSVAKKVSEWLHGMRSGDYIRLEDSYEPDIYRLAVYEEDNTLENILAKAGKCDIEFSCKPQRFLLSGEKPIGITSFDQTIVNPTNYISKPLIVADGTGKIVINDSVLEIKASFNQLTFDAESCDAYDYGNRIMNSYVYTEDSICLYPGDNQIHIEGSLYDVSIIPRWWTL